MLRAPLRKLGIAVLGLAMAVAIQTPPAGAATAAAAKKRVALVVGNAAYTSLPALTNPRNDATDIAKALEGLKFEVILKTDLDLVAMRKAIRQFRKKLKKGAVGLFYYSGHGLQVDGINYLLPIDATVEYAEDIPQVAVDANEVLNALRAKKLAFSFVILDACRNNELKRRDQQAVQGLARMDAPEGALVAYATGPNQLASDGFGRNSIYTGELLKEIDQPGLRIEDVFKRVRSSVSRTSGGRQVPVEFTSLTADFYFLPPKPGTVQTATGVALPKLKPGQEFKDCKTCPLMVVIPKGKFVMGAKKGKRDQKPAHEVTVERDFAIGKFEITFDQWDACKDEGACIDIVSDEGWGRERQPVMNVSWDDARQYVSWLSRRTGQAYSLPSEAQWEYAARANKTTAYAWGDSVGDNRANCKKCGSEWSGKQTASVGSFEPNGFGLHDMHGNVWEWTEDCWHSSYRKAPDDGSAWTTGSCTMSVLRGGSWRDNDRAAQVTTRGRYGMGSRSDFGFRVIRNIPQ